MGKVPKLNYLVWWAFWYQRLPQSTAATKATADEIQWCKIKKPILKTKKKKKAALSVLIDVPEGWLVLFCIFCSPIYKIYFKIKKPIPDKIINPVKLNIPDSNKKRLFLYEPWFEYCLKTSKLAIEPDRKSVV